MGTTPPGIAEVQGTQESKPAHNADQGGSGEKTVHGSVKVSENSKPENVDDKQLVPKNDKDNVTTEKVISDKDNKSKTENNIITEHVDEKVEKDKTKTENEIHKSKCVNDVSDEKNN